VFQPTMTQLRTFSQKPIVITETGVAPGSHQTAWIADFFHWLPQHPDVIGFIWFEFSKEQGGRTDWRMSAKPATAKAFHDAIAKVTLALPPPR
jgi:hypothetical protein